MSSETGASALPDISLKSGALIPDAIYHSGRIDGYDFARAIAVFFMILVNYYVIFPGADSFPDWFNTIAGFLMGRAAALFVMLAGVGLALMSRRAYVSGDAVESSRVRTTLLKRSLLLLVMGVLFMQWWSADILHFYSLYLIMGAYMLSASRRRLCMLILLTSALSAALYCLTEGSPPAIEDWIVTPGWMAAVMDDLLFKGYYPVFPWVMFLLVGMWIGKNEITPDAVPKRKIMIWALIVFAAAEIFSGYLHSFLLNHKFIAEDGIIDTLLISDVFPVSPLFAISAASGSVIIIVTAILMTRHRMISKITARLTCTGRLSLTIYIAHVIIGLGIQRMIALQDSDNLSRVAPLAFTLVFCLTAVVASNIWCRRFKAGPLELLLRRVSGPAGAAGRFK